LSFSIIPSLNNSGMVAFLADGSIRTGPDPVADKVIAVGDDLFGSTVVEFDDAFDTFTTISQEALNDSGQIAFSYVLADGRRGIARADPIVIPEPGTLSLLVCAVLGAMLWRLGLASADVDLRAAILEEAIAIMRPMPRDPPMTSATRLSKERRFFTLLQPEYARDASVQARQYPLQLHKRPGSASSGRHPSTVELVDHLALSEPLALEALEGRA
jgi:hypothetical protein